MEQQATRTSLKYKPLYDLLLVKEALSDTSKLTPKQVEYFTDLSKVDTVLLTGGRFSAKSFEVGDWAVEATLQHDYKTMYTRFTNVSMSDSVVPEIEEKIEINGLQPYFRWANNKCHSLCGDGLISFKGLKPSSSGQTANLKSLKGFNVLVIEEAEEIPDKETFQKVDLSIRDADKQNISVLLLNPTTTDHWIFPKFYTDYGVAPGFNGVKENVLYIHTSYLDVDPKFIPEKIIAAYDRMKVKNPIDYEHIIMGGWISDLEGVVYKKAELKRFKLADLNRDNIEHSIAFMDVADRGTDALSMPIGCVIGTDIYITNWYFSTDNQNITIPEVAGVSIREGIEHMGVETNGLGLGYYESLQKSVGCVTYPISQQTNKHSRILQNSGFVRNFIHFRDDYEAGSMYDLAMRELLSYNKDMKVNNKQAKFNDDAPDSIAGLWVLINDLVPNRWS